MLNFIELLRNNNAIKHLSSRKKGTKYSTN